MMYRFAKRALDVAAAAAGLALLSPVIAIVALAIRVSLGSPVLFRQIRPGWKGRPFRLLKFRTMRDAVDASGHPLSDRERVTVLGAWLRRLSLDELPQLWNVLTGDMSLVGPRPLLMEFLERYTPEEMRRHDVPPGITGWAQVHGRHDILFSRRLQLDLWYVDHCSFWLDVKIFGMTIARVFAMEGSRGVQEDSAVDDLGLHAGIPNSRRPREVQKLG